MPRTSGSIGKYYTFKLIENNENINCFRTSKEVAEYLNITSPTLYLFLKDNNKTKLKSKNIKIERVKIPVYIQSQTINENYIC